MCFCLITEKQLKTVQNQASKPGVCWLKLLMHILDNMCRLLHVPCTHMRCISGSLCFFLHLLLHTDAPLPFVTSLSCRRWTCFSACISLTNPAEAGIWGRCCCCWMEGDIWTWVVDEWQALYPLFQISLIAASLSCIMVVKVNHLWQHVKFLEWQGGPKNCPTRLCIR